MFDNLSQFNLKENPVTSFLDWYSIAIVNEDNADAMTLSSIDSKMMRPQSRTVLYKGFDDGQLIFYTNYSSTKGQQIDSNPEVSLLFYWHKTFKQVRIQGRVSKMSALKSDLYFQSRDRESQLASYISDQSSPIENKEKLLNKLSEAQVKFSNKAIPRPEHWGGYLVEPYEIEFFLYGKYRLNDRFLYVRNEDKWSVSRLQP